MKIQILTTPGCSSCKQLEQMLDEMGKKYEVIDVTENPDLLSKYQIMTAPGLVIDGKLVSTGIPSQEKLEKLLNK